MEDDDEEEDGDEGMLQLLLLLVETEASISSPRGVDPWLQLGVTASVALLRAMSCKDESAAPVGGTLRLEVETIRGQEAMGARRDPELMAFIAS